MLADFTGVVGASNRDGTTFDTTNFFKLGDKLVGSSFEAIFRYDTSLGQAFTDSQSDVRSGGPDWTSPISPILSATFTVGGITDTFDVSRNGSANVTNNVTGWRQTFFYTDFFPTGSPFGNALQLYVLNSPSVLNPRLTTPYSGGNLPGIGGPATDPFAEKHSASGNYFLALDPDFVTLSLAAVPETSTWVLLIGGLGMTGAMLRRRRQLATTTAS